MSWGAKAGRSRVGPEKLWAEETRVSNPKMQKYKERRPKLTDCQAESMTWQRGGGEAGYLWQSSRGVTMVRIK